MGWDYPSLFSEVYGTWKTLHYSLIRFAHVKKLCRSVSYEFPEYTVQADYDRAVAKLLNAPNTRVLIMFLSEPKMLQNFFKALDRAGATNKYILLTYDAFGPEVFEGYEHFFLGTFYIKIASSPVPGFETLYKSQSPWAVSGDSWSGQYLRDDVGCSGGGIDENCESYNSVADVPDFSWSPHYSSAMDAVTTFARAADQVIKDHCPNAVGDRDALLECVNGPTLLSYIRKSNFQGMSKYITFDWYGDNYGGFDIYYLSRLENGSYSNDVVGYIDRKTGQVSVDFDKIEWYCSGYNSTIEGPIPRCRCSDECEEHKYKVYDTFMCCWDCIDCGVNEVVSSNEISCDACPPFMWPNEQTLDTCEDIEPEVMAWTHPIAIGLESLTTLGLIMCLAIIIIFIKHSDRRVIRGSSRELMAPITGGLLIAYIAVFTYIARPSDIICYFNFGGFHLSCTLMFGPLFLKTLRLYRIFAAAEKFEYNLHFLNSTSQIIFALGIIILQVTFHF